MTTGVLEANMQHESRTCGEMLGYVIAEASGAWPARLEPSRFHDWPS